MSEGTAVSFRTVNQSPVPLGCTTEGLAYMPLHDERLRKSRAWLRARRNPAPGFYLMNLWTAAWKGTPAGSLEDDDDVLADAAMCDPSKWEEVKAEVMRGWLRCKADGRLYHPFVCEVAKEVWETRLAYRGRTATARAAKAAKRAQRAGAANSSAATNETQPEPAEKAEIVAEDASVTATKCESLRSNQEGESPPLPPSARGDRLAADWLPGGEGCQFASNLGLDPQETLDSFTDHYGAAVGIRGRSLDWNATWREWCRGAALRRARWNRGAPKASNDWMSAYSQARFAETFGRAAAA